MEQPQEVLVELVALIGPDNKITLGDSVNLQAQVSIPPNEIDTVLWSPSELVSCDSCLLTTGFPFQTTDFSVTVGSNGCLDSDNLKILVKKERPVYIPNGFSPNGDGVNDVFFIQAGSFVRKVKNFMIFDRWGETMFQFQDFDPNNPEFGWDGFHRGKLMNSGVYTWYAEIEFEDDLVEIYKGDVTLMR